MAFNYIDEDALQSDSSWHSFGLKTWLQNVRQIGAERWCKGGVTWGVDFRPTWATPWPVAWGPYFLYVPDPSLTTIDVTVTYDSITYTDGGDCFRTAVTTEDEKPPERDWEWQAQTAVAGKFVQTCNIIRPGWQHIWIWTESKCDLTELEFGTTSVFQNPGGVELTGSALGVGVPYEALRVRQPDAVDHSAQGGGDIGNLFLNCYYDTAGGRDCAWTAPPMPYLPAGYAASRWSRHELAAMTPTGISFVAKGDAVLPDDESMNIHRPCDWQRHQQPLAAMINLNKMRVPTYSCAPGFDTAGDWYFLGKNMSTDVALDSTLWIKAGSAIVESEIPNATGYKAIVALRHLTWLDTTGVTEWFEEGVVDLTLRLVAYPVGGGAAIVANTITYDDIELAPRNWGIVPTAFGDWVPAGGWVPINQTMWGVEAFSGQWALRGACVGEADIGLLKFYEVEIPKASFTYPCDLHVELQIGDDVANAVCVAGCGIAAQVKDIEVRLGD